MPEPNQSVDAAPAAGTLAPDSPEARAYNAQKRWLSLSDTAISFIFLFVLLLTHGSAWLRDLSNKIAGDHYALALLIYVAALAVIANILGLPLQLYGYKLEDRYHLS